MKKIIPIGIVGLLVAALLLWINRSPPPLPPVPVDAGSAALSPTTPPALPEQRPRTSLPAEGVTTAQPGSLVEDLGATQDRGLAEQNDVRAQIALGERYLTGNGVPLDEAEALRWYQKAAKQGNSAAQLQVGRMYENGQGAEKNLDRANIWFTRAAESGDAAAQTNLADMYEFGEKFRSDKAAAYWNEQAATQGYPTAQRNLGRMYQNGTGVPKDNVEAYVWYAVAAANGDQSAARGRDVVSATLSTEELSAAKTRVRDWKPKRPGGP